MLNNPTLSIYPMKSKASTKMLIALKLKSPMMWMDSPTTVQKMKSSVHHTIRRTMRTVPVTCGTANHRNTLCLMRTSTLYRPVLSTLLDFDHRHHHHASVHRRQRASLLDHLRIFDPRNRIGTMATISSSIRHRHRIPLLPIP